MSGSFVIVVLLVCGLIAGAIAQSKNLSVASGFVLGALLGIIGIGIVLFQAKGLPKAPAGMRAVKCPTCNAVQNIGVDQPELVCWQCHLVTSSSGLGQPAPEDLGDWLGRMKK